MRIRFAYQNGSDYRKIYLPVIPPNFSEKFSDKTEYVTTINGIEKSIPKLPGAKTVTFQSYFPFNIDDPLASEPFNTPDYYVNFFNECQSEKRAIKMSITGDTIMDLFQTERWYLPHIQWEYKAKSFDIWYTLTLKEFVPVKYATAVVTSTGKQRSKRKNDGFAINNIVTVTGDYLTTMQISGNSKQGIFNTSVRADNQTFVDEVCKIILIQENRENGYKYYVQSSENFSKAGWVQQSALKPFTDY